MKKTFCILGIVLLTLLFLILLINILYWGLILVSAFIGVWAFIVIGIIVYFLVVGYIKTFKSLINKIPAPKRP